MSGCLKAVMRRRTDLSENSHCGDPVDPRNGIHDIQFAAEWRKKLLHLLLDGCKIRVIIFDPVEIQVKELLLSRSDRTADSLRNLFFGAFCLPAHGFQNIGWGECAILSKGVQQFTSTDT